MKKLLVILALAILSPTATPCDPVCEWDPVTRTVVCTCPSDPPPPTGTGVAQ